MLQAKGNVRPRAGGLALSLLSDPLNVHVLRVLERESKPLIELRRTVGSPPQTTMRGHLKVLTTIGALVRLRQNQFPGSVDYELGAPGRELLGVADALQSWLGESPEGPIALGSTAAKSSTKALVEGWSSTIVRALAARPLSLTELNRLISGLNYPSIERRLASMRTAGLIEARSSEARGTPYAATDWLRRAIAPISAACLWERRHIPALATAVGRIDVEAGFLLSIPVLRLPDDLSGACRLAVEFRNGKVESRLAGVLVEVRDGRVVSCLARLQGHADAWASGSADAWFSAVNEGDTGRLEIGGDWHLVTALLDALHDSLFGARQRG